MKEGYSNLHCGLIGKKLGHSFSPMIHNMLADYSFELCELAPEQLETFVRSGKLDAFCVTIPYKKDVIPLLDEISPEAQAIGSVNVVVRGKDGKIRGYNTDYFGFDYMLRRAGVSVEGKKAVVFGRGGASATICALLKDKKVGQLITFDIDDNTPENMKKHGDARIIVNATPMGMYPNNGAAATSLSYFPNCEAVLDIVYNPARTALMLDAEKRGIVSVGGLSMLVAQAAKAFDYFTEDKYEEGIIEKILSSITYETSNLILVGMPGCGKTTVGKTIAEITNREFLDADEEFTKTYSITPADAINTYGEEKFREMETHVLEDLGKLSGKVIATGGGAVTKERNYPVLHQNGVIVFLERALENLPTDNRPISQQNSLAKLYEKRINSYVSFADVRIQSTEVKEKTAELIIEKFKEHIDKEVGCK